MARPPKYSEKDCIEALKQAGEILGHPPSHQEYEELSIKPSGSCIQRRLGGWNEAKKCAGMPLDIEPRSSVKPDSVNHTDEEWENLSAATRLRHRKSHWVDQKKLEQGCVKCGYDKIPEALDWHHEDDEEKNHSVGNMVQKGLADKDIRSEISKCVVLCTRCHREVEFGYKSLK
jgi:hypothetical protein